MKILTLVALFILGFTVNAQNNHNGGHNNGSIVTCSSIKKHRQTCRADTSGGVRLVRQLSRSSCHENWGYTHDQIWVDHGCRAEFQLNTTRNNNGNHNTNSGYNNNGNHNINNGYNNNDNHNNYNGYNNNGNHNNNNGYNNNGNHNNNNRNASHGSIILCESINSHQASCSIPHDSRVTFSRQISRSSCERNWGFNENSIWVTNGCRAEFIVSPDH